MSKKESEIGQADSVESKSDPKKSKPESPKGVYATDYFKANNISHCDRCGEQFHSDAQGNPVCPESLTDCPRIK